MERMKTLHRLAHAALVLLVALAATVSAACDKDAAKPAPAPAESSPPASPPAQPEPPKVPRAPTVMLDDRSLTIDGASIEGGPTDWGARVADLLASKPKVEGEAVAVDVMRDAHTPRVVAVVAALAAAKAKSVVVRTPTRDRTMGELGLSLHSDKAPDCSVVGFIEKDGAVAVWSRGGGGAQRYSHGMAGPDVTTSSEALARRAAGCDSSAWYVGGAESVTWGLVFDLATHARATDAGFRPHDTTLVSHVTVSGRRLKLD